MAAAAGLRGLAVPAAGPGGLRPLARGALLRPGGLAHGVGERFEVVTAGAGGSGVDGETDDFPATGAVRRSECSAHRS